MNSRISSPDVRLRLTELVESSDFLLLISIAEGSFSASHRTPHEIEHIHNHNVCSKLSVEQFIKTIFSVNALIGLEAEEDEET
jgi:hypothetical protein